PAPMPPDLLARLRERASHLDATIVLAEGEDPRVVAAAERAAATGLCRPLLVGRPEVAAAAAESAGVALSVPVLVPDADPDLPALAAFLAERLRSRGYGERECDIFVRDPLYYACLRVGTGRADGAV